MISSPLCDLIWTEIYLSSAALPIEIAVVMPFACFVYVAMLFHLLRILRNVIYVRNVYIRFGAATAIGFIHTKYMNIKKTVRDGLFSDAQHY